MTKDNATMTKANKGDSSFIFKTFVSMIVIFTIIFIVALSFISHSLSRIVEQEMIKVEGVIEEFSTRSEASQYVLKHIAPCLQSRYQVDCASQGITTALSSHDKAFAQEVIRETMLWKNAIVDISNTTGVDFANRELKKQKVNEAINIRLNHL